MKLSVGRSLAVVAVTSLLAAGCAAPESSGSSADEYKLGVMLPLTGPLASIGESFRTGIEMAAEQINADGGIDGTDLEVVFEDTQGTPEGGVEAMNKFVNVENAPMVVTATSGQTLSAQPIASQRDVLLMNVGGASPNLLELDALYNNAVNINALGPILANHLFEQGYRRIAFVGTADPFGEGSVEAMAPVWEELGGEVVAEQSVALTDTDYGGQMLKVRSGRPDVVIATATGEVLGQLVQQARAAGIDVPMAGPLGTDGLTSVAGKAAEGFIDVSMTVADPSSAPGSPAAEFYTDYEAEFGAAPSWIPGTAYETVYLFKSLIEQALEDGDDPTDGAVLEELVQGAEFDDVLQAGDTVNFLDDHSVARTVAIREVVDGAFDVVETVRAGDAE